MNTRILLAILFTLLPTGSILASAGAHEPAYTGLEGGEVQYAHFPKPLETYDKVEGGLMDVLKARASEEPFNVAATIIFILAIMHTFAAGSLNKLAHKFDHAHQQALTRKGPRGQGHPEGEPEVSFKATLFHFLGEVEAIFGIWVLVLMGAGIYFHSWLDVELYINEDKDFTEPLFVFVIMAIAASRPILRAAEVAMSKAAGLGQESPGAWWLSVLIIAPVLGSFITEPAAMTIGAMLLAKKFYILKPRATFAYATIGLLFVNISVGGTLTHFAAPPVLMVSTTWEWGTAFMLTHFGWKAMIGIAISSLIYFMYFKKDLKAMADRADGSEDGIEHPETWSERETPVPVWITIVHMLFLGWTVYTAHFPVLFVGGFLFFLAMIMATRHHQNHVSLRTPMLVGFFLAGLVIHGGCQSWWIDPVIRSLGASTLMLGSTVLTAFNDNAAITYLASQVTGLSPAMKTAVVAGAVTGGGLTVIANAPNPAGQSILSKFFKDGISPLGLFLGALLPTVVVYLCFMLLPSGAKSVERSAEKLIQPIEKIEILKPEDAGVVAES